MIQNKTSMLQMISSLLIFGSVGMFVYNSTLPCAQLALLRAVIGCCVLGSALILLRKRVQWGMLRKNLWVLLCSGAAIAINWIFLFQSYQYTSVANTTISYYCAPVFVVLASPLVLKEKLTGAKLLCIGCCALGVAMVAGVFGGAAAGGSNNPLGVALGLIAAAFYACVMLLNKFLKGLSGLESTLAQMGFAVLILLPYVLLTQYTPLAQIERSTLLCVLTLGVVHTGVAYLLYFSALPVLPAQTAAMLSYIDPVTAILLSALVLRQPMSMVQVLGACLILGATFASEWAAGRSRKIEAP